MTSIIQERLRSGEETLETLASRYFIKAKVHPEHTNLVMLKYNQINSPMENPLVHA